MLTFMNFIIDPVMALRKGDLVQEKKGGPLFKIHFATIIKKVA